MEEQGSFPISSPAFILRVSCSGNFLCLFVIVSGAWIPRNGIAGLKGMHILHFGNHFFLLLLFSELFFTVFYAFFSPAEL